MSRTEEEATADQPSGSISPVVVDRSEQRSALLRLLVIVAAGVVAAVVTGTGRTVAVVASLIVMIMLHEAGHFVTAKWSGMKVTEFFVGFGPRLWSVRKGETEYGVKALPLGGYVKVLGMNNLEEVDPDDEPRTYRQKSFPRRLTVVAAGSAVHFMLAILLFFVAFAFVGVPTSTMEISQIVPSEGGQATPAAQSGLREGDVIVSIDGNRFEEWTEVREYIASRPGVPLAFLVQRGSHTVELSVTPVQREQVEIGGSRVATTNEGGFVGVVPGVAFERIDPVTAAGRSVTGFASGTWQTLRALGSIFSPDGIGDYFTVLTGGQPEGATVEDGGDVRFLSPVGFARIASQAARAGLFEVVQLLILINIFVGVFNMLPLLPLDGGHVAIATYEAIRSKIAGRRHMVDVARLMPATYLVLLIIVFIGVTSLYLDIVRPLGNPFE